MTPLLTHRCAEHLHVAPLNNAATIVMLHAEGRAVQQKPVEDFGAECAACLGDQVDGLWALYLDTLDMLADWMKAHAALRVRHETPNLILPPGV